MTRLASSSLCYLIPQFRRRVWLKEDGGLSIVAFRPNHGQLFHNLVREGLPTIRPEFLSPLLVNNNDRWAALLQDNAITPAHRLLRTLVVLSRVFAHYVQQDSGV